jgi:hypothetical protein
MTTLFHRLVHLDFNDSRRAGRQVNDSLDANAVDAVLMQKPSDLQNDKFVSEMSRSNIKVVSNLIHPTLYHFVPAT